MKRNPRTLAMLWPLLLALLLPLGCDKDLSLPGRDISEFSPYDFTITDDMEIPDDALYIEFIDVGQGDGIYLTTSDGHSAVVDGGRSTKDMRTELLARGVDKLDYVFATHADADHIGGLEAVVTTIDVGLYVDNGMPHTTATYEDLMSAVESRNIPYEVAQAGTVYMLGDSVSMQVLSPISDLDNQNANSVVLRVSHGQHTFLLTGDAELETERVLIAAGIPRTQVLKVGHHGASTSTGDAFVQALQPEFAIVSVGENNYGHPTSEVLNRLNSYGVEIMRTDQLGTIEFRSSEGELCYRSVSQPQYQCEGTQVVEPTTDALEIVEVYFDHESGDDGYEWVKLYNPTAESVDLGAYTLGYGGSDLTYGLVPLSGTIAAASCYVIGGPSSEEANGSPSFDLSYNFEPDLQNGGDPADGVALFDKAAEEITASTTPIDIVLYGESNASSLPGSDGNPANVDIEGASSGQSILKADGTWSAGSPMPASCP